MSVTTGAILLDTRSIQRYVFGCNKLKTNTGASYLVTHIFEEAMDEVLDLVGFKNRIRNWEKNTSLQMLSDDTVDCETAYVGGGNMLLLVRKGADKNETLSLCRKIVAEWSERLLVAAPGLKTGAAVGMMNIDDASFTDSLNGLYKQLKENQNKILPQTDLPYTGLTLECSYSGKTANVLHPDESEMIASEVRAKLDAYQYADEELCSKYNKILRTEQCEYDFCSELESIGYKEGESYISIIHIDGNNMGVKFSKCRSMQERKELSQKVASVVEDGFRKLLSSIIDEYASYKNILDMDKLKQGNKKLLPIRPIIIGGDDVTFICPGRLGLVYAERFIKAVNGFNLLDDDFYQYLLQQKESSGKKISKNLSCCAGVAIVPAKYPFFRAYELAEELCGAAKKLSRADDGNYLEYAVLHGEISGELEQLRRQQYHTAVGNLHYGPYNVTDVKADNALQSLFALSKKLAAPNMPANKVKELRSVLHEDLHSMQIFLDNCPEIRALLQKEKGADDANALWENDGQQSRTRFIDAVEIIDFMNWPVQEDEQ